MNKFEIAPLLRGLSFDGEKGDIVVFKEQIEKYLSMGLTLMSVQKIINNQLEIPISYTALRYFVLHEPELRNTAKVR